MRTELFLLAAVIVASGCIGQNTSNTDTTPKQPAETSSPTNISTTNTVVYYTASGFQPQTIDIEKGDTVTWVNNASTSMWVGSDRHPTHTQYSGTNTNEHCQSGDQNQPAFDQCSTGERFNFTFEKEGEWGYHNHRAAGDTGTVVVN
ncbi:MAG: hypothetical protein H8Z69_04465 [Nanohaloarchaea archaeon]|nr:hypothetical protein [Candidatus Nanohaloarchaea archaeon]